MVTFCGPNSPYEETLLQPVYLDQIPAIPLTGCVLQLSGLYLFPFLEITMVNSTLTPGACCEN